MEPIRVFRNRAWAFEEMTSQWGFSNLSGCWNSIAAGDFDGDGRTIWQWETAVAILKTHSINHLRSVFSMMTPDPME
jgi:hypothetical protein